MANGIEVAETNLDSTNLPDKTFSSEALSPKDVIEGEGTLTTDGSGNATGTVFHGLAYPPNHLFFFKPGNTNAVAHPGVATWIDNEKSTTWGLMDNFTLTVFSAEVNMSLRIVGLANTKYSYKYFIFVERAK